MIKKLFFTLTLLAMTVSMSAQKTDMNQFIDNLMSRMTLDEKIGQLTLLPGGDVTTGQLMNSPLAERAQQGRLGAVLSC